MPLYSGQACYYFLSKENQKNQLRSGDLFTRRQLWLILLGLINSLIFLWSGDMLFHLGIMGILLFPFVRMSRRGLLIAAITVTFIYSGKNYWQYADDRKAHKKYLAVLVVEKKISKDSADKAIKDSLSKKGSKDSLSKNFKKDSLLQKKDTLTKEQQDDKGAWEGIVGNMKYDPKKDDGNKKAMRSVSYGKLWNHLLPVTQSKEAQWTYQTGIWDFASMILLGMALFKFWFFNSRLSRQRYLLIAIAGLTAGILLAWFRIHYNQVALKDYAKFIDDHWFSYTLFFPFERGFMALGYTSLILALIGTKPLNRLWFGFARRRANGPDQLSFTKRYLHVVFYRLWNGLFWKAESMATLFCGDRDMYRSTYFQCSMASVFPIRPCRMAMAVPDL